MSQSLFHFRQFRDENHEPLVDYILLAEFDIDTGSTVRHQFPVDVPGYKADWFAENMLPEGAHNRTQDWTYMFLNRTEAQNYWIRPSEETSVDSPERRFLYGVNLVKTKYDASVRRGAIVKAMAIFSRYHYLDMFSTPLDIALEKYFTAPSVSILEELFSSLNSLRFTSLPRPDGIEFAYLKRIQAPITASIDGTLFDAPIQLSVPVHHTPDELLPTNLTLLVSTFREQTMRIFHAILTSQRVLFVGYNHAAGDVCRLVLSAVNMVSPPIANVIRRAFPYANLSDLSFLETPGYVAGVTNPMFQQHDTWWDLLCTLDLPNNKGVVQTAEEKRIEDAVQKGKPAPATTLRPPEECLHEAIDAKFIARVLSGIEAGLSEDWVRQQFYEYTHSILLQAHDQSRLLMSKRVHDKTKKLFLGNCHRITLLKQSVEYTRMPENLWIWTGSLPLDKLLVMSQLRKFQVESHLHSVETQAIFADLDTALHTEASLQALLCYLPDSAGGLAVLAAGLFHSEAIVRCHTVRLLQRIDSFESTKVAMKLNPFLTGALQRQIQKLSDILEKHRIGDVNGHI